jgi:hypothetical protein
MRDLHPRIHDAMSPVRAVLARRRRLLRGSQHHGKNHSRLCMFYE